MKRNQLLVLSVLVFGLQGVAQASPYPADAEASRGLPGIETVSFGVSGHDMQASAYPADAEASLGLPGIETVTFSVSGGDMQASAYPADAEASLGLPGEGDRATAWGVSERDKSNDPFPVGMGFTAE